MFLSSKSSSTPAVIKAIAFASGMLSFLAFGCLLFSSTSAYLLSGEIETHDPKTGAKVKQLFGIGPFVAGSSTRSSEVVWWSELNDGNCCNRTLEIYSKWALPNHLCDAEGHFIVPSVIVAIQVISSIATAFSFIACSVAFSSHQQLAIRTTACSSFVAMVFACTHFALWTTFPLSTRLQGMNGAVIPLWHATDTTRIVPSAPVRMSFGLSYVLFVLSFILLFVASTLSYSVARLPARFFEEYDDEGIYGMGKL